MLLVSSPTNKHLDNNREVPFARSFDACQEQVVNRMFVPFGGWPLLKMLGTKKEREMKHNVKVINDFVYDIIAQRRKQLVTQTYFTTCCPVI
jgi:hypothetical protein